MRYKNSDDNRYRVQFMRSTEELIDACVIDGLVYATYEDGLILKDLIWAYNDRH